MSFTSVLLPADLTEINVSDPATAQLRFQPGPIFTQILLADEAPARTAWLRWLQWQWWGLDLAWTRWWLSFDQSAQAAWLEQPMVWRRCRRRLVQRIQ